MHQCLCLPEILQEVVRFVAAGAPTDVETGDLNRLADLARLARTCKLFYEPTMNVLWEYLDGFDPLFRSAFPWQEDYPEAGQSVSAAYPTFVMHALVENATLPSGCLAASQIL